MQCNESVTEVDRHHFSIYQHKHNSTFSVAEKFVILDPEGGSQKATLVVVVVVISSLKVPKAFLIRSGAQRNFAYTFVLTFHTDLVYRLRFFSYFVINEYLAN